MIFILILCVENFLYYDAIHDILVWLRTGSNLADIDRRTRFESLTEKKYFWK